MGPRTQLVKAKKTKAVVYTALRTPPLSTEQLSDQARRAAEDILLAGQAENTLRAYRSAMRYWCAWAQARYGKALALPVPVPVVVQFIVDHTARLKNGERVIELPKDTDEHLVAAGFKSALGALKMSTVSHRLYVLSKLHQLRKEKNPCEDPEVRHLVARAKRAAVKLGETERKKTAATREPLEAMLATCDDSLAGVRDKALLLFAWGSGGRRRSEVSAATVDQLRKIDDQTYLFTLVRSKTNQSGEAISPEKPVRGRAAEAMTTWLARAGITEGPIFRRVWKSVAGPALSAQSVAAIVKRRAALAGISGDWAAHSLRAGFITEAGRRKIPLGDIMAMTDHRNAATVVGYHRAGELFESEIATLADRS